MKAYYKKITHFVVVLFSTLCLMRAGQLSAITNDGQGIRVGPDDASGFAQRGFAFAKNGDFDKAITNLNEAIRLNPSDAVSYNNLGHAYLQKGDLDKAITNLNEAIRLDPKDVSAYDSRGIAYSKKGDFDRAISNFSKTLEIAPKNARLYNNRGIAYSEKGDFHKAISDFSEVLRMVPDNAKTLCNRGGVYIKAGEWEKALKDLNVAIRFDSKDADAYNSLAWLLATCPDISIRKGKKGVFFATRACELTRWHKWYCIGTLAAACAEVGDFGQAVKYQQQAMSLQGANDKERLDEQQRLLLYQEHKPYHEPTSAK